MKAAHFLFAMLFLLVACSSKSTNSEPGPTGNTSAPITSVDSSTSQANANACFIGSDGNDSAHLRLFIAGEQATGEFSKTKNGKVESSGSIQGQLVGDTLLAWYTENNATEQMVFIINNTVAVKGEGEMTEKDGKKVLKDPAKADFKNGLHMAKVACNQ